MRRQFIAIAVAALFVAGAVGVGVSYAVTPRVQVSNAKGIIASCYNTTDGQIRVVNTATTCSTGERKLTWSQRATKPVVHVVGTAGEPAYTPTFKAYKMRPYGNLSFYKDVSGVVHLTGLTCKRGTLDPSSCAQEVGPSGTRPIFTLPPQFRPQSEQVFSTLSFGNGLYLHARVDVTKAGVVEIIAPPDVGLEWMSFDGVSFLSK